MGGNGPASYSPGITEIVEAVDAKWLKLRVTEDPSSVGIHGSAVVGSPEGVEIGWTQGDYRWSTEPPALWQFQGEPGTVFGWVQIDASALDPVIEQILAEINAIENLLVTIQLEISELQTGFSFNTDVAGAGAIELPSYVSTVRVIMYGAGGGAGSGDARAGAANQGGGAGGGAGHRGERTYLVSEIGTSLTWTLGLPGVGGLPVINNVRGNDGTAGGNAVFMGGLFTAYGGGGGRGGAENAAAGGGGGGGSGGPGATASGATGGIGGLPQSTAASGTDGVAGEGGNGAAVSTTPGGSSEYGGGGGGGAGTNGVGTVGGSSLQGGGGGGSGGASSSAAAAIQPFAGGSAGRYVEGGGGTPGVSGAAPTPGSDGDPGTSYQGGDGGGGGGASNVDAPGAPGGNGGTGGGGGGGGGSARSTTQPSGAGGDGGAARIFIQAW